jgi:hypothetical protein
VNGASSALASDSVRVDGTYPTTNNVQALGTQANEYQVSRKLYLNSTIGYSNFALATGDTSTGELDFAQWEAVAGNVDPILDSIGYFRLSPNQHPNGLDGSGRATPFCEDFNQEMICTADSPATPNTNACCTNPSGIPSDTSCAFTTVPGTSTSTICGNGVQDPYEECDDGTKGDTNAVNGGNGSSTSHCSTICRCAGTFSYKSNGTTFGCN